MSYRTYLRYQATLKLCGLKLIEIVILWVYYTIPFGFSLLGTFEASLLKFLNYSVGLTEEGSLPEMRIWSILLIKSEYLNGVHILVEAFFILEMSGTDIISFPREHKS